MIAAQGQQICYAFPLGHVQEFRHAADGMMAQIWRLDTTVGSYAVKEFDDVPDRYELHARLRVANQLADAAAQAGICTPRGVRSSTGGLLYRLDADDAGDAAYISVGTWIEGRPCDARRDATRAASWLGKTVATIELLPDPPDAPALDPWLTQLLTEAPTRVQWGTALDRAQRAGRTWAPLLQSRIAQLIGLGSIVGHPRDGDVSLLHTDLQPKNVLVTRTGFVLLDWDDAALCSRDQMLGRTLIEWLTPGGIDAAAITNFMRAYRSYGGSGTIGSLSDFGYAAAAFLNYTYETIMSDVSENRYGDGLTSSATAALTNPLNISTLERVLQGALFKTLEGLGSLKLGVLM